MRQIVTLNGEQMKVGQAEFYLIPEITYDVNNTNLHIRCRKCGEILESGKEMVIFQSQDIDSATSLYYCVPCHSIMMGEMSTTFELDLARGWNPEDKVKKGDENEIPS